MTPLQRILVVEDNVDLREVIRLQLEFFGGYEVELAGDAETALEQMGDNQPDALLVDIALPGMDGSELCRAIRANPALPLIPILLYSAMTSSDARVQSALKLPAVRYQSKGGSTRTLQTALETLLQASVSES